MPKAARLGDLGSGHECFPPSPAIEGSSDIIINGRPAVRVGDAYVAHGCNSCIPHPRNAAEGSSTVNFNGRPAVRVGDGINCGGKAQIGSSNVFVGDKSWNGKTGEVDIKARFVLSQVPGSADYPYSSTPYKLYKGGGLIQQGSTDDEGLIELDEMPDKGSTYTIEMANGDKFNLSEVAFAPPETQVGIKQRMGALGYLSDKDGLDLKGKESEEEWKADIATRSDEEKEDWQERLVSELKKLMP